MRKLKKCAIITGGVIVFITTMVAAKNAIDENRQDSKLQKGFYHKYIKRPQDFCCSLLAMIILSPVLISTAILIRIKLGSPIIFIQDRPGKGEKVFKLMKFRTMTEAKDENGNLLSDDERLTKFGRFLRATSLDELPELINIIKGDMAVVGPRPLLTDYLPYYREHEHHRHDVRPGLTGLAQVNGRNAINNWEERFGYDLEYVNNVSMAMDMKILFQTVYKVFRRSDVQVGSEIKAGRLDNARRSNNQEV